MSGSDRHDPHEPYEWREPTRRNRPTWRRDDDGAYGAYGAGEAPGHGERAAHDGRPARDGEDEQEQQAGKGNVNDRPEDEGRRPDPEDAAAHGGDGGDDDLFLRELLHGAVDGLAPRTGTLEHLRRAVPARRARKRQALVGAAAAALFMGTAIPAVVHVSNSTSSAADSSIAGNSRHTQGGSGPDNTPVGDSGGTADKGSTTGKGDKSPAKDTTGKGKGSTGVVGGTVASASAATAPTCTAAQLGGATSTAGSPDSTGTVYGTFTVSNISSAVCTVSGPGTMSTAAVGAADASKITVVDHAAGDAATGLPDPATAASSLVLLPGSSYVVQFAWVPSETCPTTGSDTGGTTPSPSSSTDTTTSDGGTTSSGTDGTTTQLLREDTVADGSIVVSYTTAATSPTVTTTVANACAGTVYRTGLLAASTS
ncbi:hypothetical protein OK074_8727 [Actinobacteria bacterium OK074]|nr:hypothetical protein OK074_8727 [Actinobacteria bacterium OK074]